MPIANHLLRLVFVFFVVMLAPRGMMARVRGLDVEALWRLTGCLERLHRVGRKLRYPGESLATVAARIDLLVWIARDPVKANRHLGRQTRGWRRWRAGDVCPPSWAPPRLPCAQPTTGWSPRAAAADP